MLTKAAALLRERADGIARLLTMEQGKAALGCCQRLVQVGRARQRHFGNCLATGRIDHGKQVAPLPDFPAAIDEQRQVGVVSLGHGYPRYLGRGISCRAAP
ncbi:MAG: hypothetical protein ACK44O_08600 [Novosphingobium sp.]